MMNVFVSPLMLVLRCSKSLVVRSPACFKYRARRYWSNYWSTWEDFDVHRGGFRPHKYHVAGRLGSLKRIFKVSIRVL